MNSVGAPGNIDANDEQLSVGAKENTAPLQRVVILGGQQRHTQYLYGTGNGRALSGSTVGLPGCSGTWEILRDDELRFGTIVACDSDVRAVGGAFPASSSTNRLAGN